MFQVFFSYARKGHNTKHTVRKNVKTIYAVLCKFTNMTMAVDFSYFSKSLKPININDIPKRILLYHLASKRGTNDFQLHGSSNYSAAIFIDANHFINEELGMREC